ncbi:ribulose bisphosphate carboxylase small subunit, chloroplastic isoform X2 [Populus trichocarpa]|uniref:ribulose bisphosphate carboxylase small subunit, chloroplastic isoform X2 n=1 Tax=Populus trichocarpa TaxID=3694 RepID=UPI000D189530|nr:ribulose bisphosphate carboxylase small subunit, chloroplastic isoform X2 [Populus trichocarpa]|eukprot:XP_024454471.1 ribulose bisphosphate carboxylase small chain, chloroplastic isoform X2 [Populus trichocarpa]
MASSSMISSAAVATVNRTPVQANMVAPFNGLKSAAAFPVSTRKANDITSIASNGGRVQCMQVWPPTGLKKFETLSYLPDLTEEELAKEIDYLLRSKWVPCLEFEKVGSTVSTTAHQGTMMDATGLCGSYPCLDALRHLKCCLSLRRQRKLTLTPLSV